MDQDVLKKRTKQFTIDVIRFVRDLPHGREGWYLGDQLYRAGASAGANYRAACRSKTKATFVHKLGLVEEEADECCFWLEILLESEFGNKEKVKRLLKEANELTAIFTAAGRTLNDTKNKKVVIPGTVQQSISNRNIRVIIKK
jgi:four helix bundle protein